MTLSFCWRQNGIMIIRRSISATNGIGPCHHCHSVVDQRARGTTTSTKLHDIVINMQIYKEGKLSLIYDVLML